MIKNSILGVILFTMFAALPCSGAAQDAPSQIVQAVNELKEQQARIADNQTKIDSKISDLAETIRVARLFMSRVGGGHKPAKK
jgi:hypothetical protein